jgi:hypothetical protein
MLHQHQKNRDAAKTVEFPNPRRFRLASNRSSERIVWGLATADLFAMLFSEPRRAVVHKPYFRRVFIAQSGS